MAEKTFVVGDARVGSNQLGWVELFFPQFWFNLSYCHWEKNKNNKRKAVPLCYSLLCVFGFNSCFSLFYPIFFLIQDKAFNKAFSKQKIGRVIAEKGHWELALAEAPQKHEAMLWFNDEFLNWKLHCPGFELTFCNQLEVSKKEPHSYVYGDSTVVTLTPFSINLSGTGRGKAAPQMGQGLLLKEV